MPLATKQRHDPKFLTFLSMPIGVVLGALTACEVADSAGAAYPEQLSSRGMTLEYFAAEMDDLTNALESSPLSFIDGEILIDESSVLKEELPRVRRLQQIANHGLELIDGGDLSNTRKVLVIEKSEANAVIFDLHLPPGTLGGSFSYALILDKETGKLVQGYVSD